MNILDSLEHSFIRLLQKTFNLEHADTRPITFALNTDESKQAFGDISSNAAMVLSKKLHKNPREIAQMIVDAFADTAIEKIDIAGPGFLNIFLTQNTFETIAREITTQKDTFFQPTNTDKQTYSLEFVSANPTGPLHLGHGRGGIIGDVLGNILRFLGNDVVKEYYINDAGVQIKKLGISFKIRCEQALGNDVPLPEDGYHGLYLVDLAEICIEKYGKDVLQKDASFFSKYAEEHMLERIKHTLEEYGIHFDVWFSEKTLHESNAIQKGLRHLAEHGYTYEKDGALWFTSEKFGDDKDRVLKKADDTLTYVAADIAYMENKINRGADKMIMILGQDHHSYVVRLKGLLEALGYSPEKLDVILYQLVTLKEGGQQLRMSKRAGKMVTLRDIIQTVGTDVARFFYLNKKADAHLDFDLDLALKKTEENPVYYIQYAYVRTNSILQKSQEHNDLYNITPDDAQYLSKEESLLLKKIVQLKHQLQTIGKNYQTHALTYYVLDLAQAFHKYYSKHRVINIDEIDISRGRLLMVNILKETIGLCLSLLGITKPEKM